MSTFRKAPFESLLNRHSAMVEPATALLLRDFVQLLSEQEISLTSLLNQGLRIPDNFDGAVLSFTTDVVANTQTTIAHGLRKTPTYFIVLNQDKGGVLYRSAAFDSTNGYFKCSVATMAVTIFVF